MNPLLSIRKLGKAFGPLQVLESIDLDLVQGEFLTLLGPSGCGKTTLLRCIAGLEYQDSGSIHLGVQDFSTLDAKERGIGMVFQHYALFPAMTVLDNLLFGLKAHGIKGEAARKQAMDALAMVRLTEKAASWPHQLSGGQQQRVALARALVLKPRILLLDEPLSALDAQIRRTLRTEIRELQQSLKMTTILVTHDQEEAFAISDRLCLMHQGRILQTGSPQEIYHSPRHEITARFLGNYNILASVELAGWTWAGPSPRAGSPIPPTGALAPEEIQVEHLDYPGIPENCLCSLGTVEDATPLGGIRRYRVRTGPSVLVVDQLNSLHKPWLKSGMKVKIQLRPESIHALEPIQTGEPGQNSPILQSPLVSRHHKSNLTQEVHS